MEARVASCCAPFPSNEPGGADRMDPLTSPITLLGRWDCVSLLSRLLIPRPAAPYVCIGPRAADSTMEAGLDDAGVMFGVLLAVVGDSVPILDFLLPERGVILELSKLDTGVEIPSLDSDIEGDSVWNGR